MAHGRRGKGRQVAAGKESFLKSAPLLRQTPIFRSAFFVIANLVGYSAANAFLYYLSTGRWTDFSPHSYRAALAAPLSEMLLHPLSIFSQPWLMVVGGMLVAAVVFVPIIVAVLYRLRISALFVLVVAVIAHAPLLSGFLATGCLLAGRTGLRRRLPFAAILAGLCPAMIYLQFFSFGDEQALMPLQRVTLLLVFVSALIAAVLAGAVVLVLARLTRFRPGVIWPVLLVFLAAPVWLYYDKIGPAELDYALIAGRVGPGDAIFSPPDAGDLGRYLPRIAAQPQSRPASQPGSRPSSQPGDTLVSQRFTALRVSARMDLDHRRKALMDECSDFLQRYPDSARAPAVTWIMVTAKDVRIDKQALAAGSVKYVYVGPTAESKGAWADLAERYCLCPQAYVAHHRQGVQAIRDGRLRKGYDHLRTAQSLLMTHLAEPETEFHAGWSEVFAATESLPGREYYRKVLADNDIIIWLMEINNVRHGSAKNTEAFRNYMRLWPFIGADSKELLNLAEGFGDTELDDNFRLQAILADKAHSQDPSKTARDNKLDLALKLSQPAGEVNDAAIAANYELGRLALRLADTPDWSKMKLKTAEYYFGVVKSAQESPYLPAAKQYLDRLKAGKKTPALTPTTATAPAPASFGPLSITR